MALVFLAGGGSVGHLAPGFCVRDALRAAGHDAVFATPGEAREADWFSADEPARVVVPAPRRPKGALGTLLFPARLVRAVRAARRTLRVHRPVAVLALGGWPCFPTAYAARGAGVPLYLLATDAVPGVVVRRLARRAEAVFVTDARAVDALPAGARTVVVPPLVRRAVLDARPDPARFGLAPGRTTLLVVGGSLGAAGLNAAVRAGLVAAARTTPGLASRLQVIHATGSEAEAAAARADYEAAGLAAHVAPYVPAIGEALASSDLVVCRGGASTLAEVAALGLPAVVVPYPHHADRQQFMNAEPLAACGQAVVVEQGALDPSTFRREVLDLLLDPAALAARRRPRGRGAGSAPGGAGEVDAAATIAAHLVRSMEARASGRGAP